MVGGYTECFGDEHHHFDETDLIYTTQCEYHLTEVIKGMKDKSFLTV